jgi:DNA-3-methyladenine glycosylase I
VTPALPPGLVSGDDGVVRCWWGAADPLYRSYHDDEWGRPVAHDDRLFEMLNLEGFQAGLSWLTVLRKRPAFREAFAGFVPSRVAAFSRADADRLVLDAGIIRHRGKIDSTINNARQAASVSAEFGSLAAYFWSHEPPRRADPLTEGQIPAKTDESVALSKDLKRRGWSFVGPTTVYAFMQAVGLVNDHLGGCARWAAAEADRARLRLPAGPAR